jgi:hypothetical protein
LLTSQDMAEGLGRGMLGALLANTGQTEEEEAEVLEGPLRALFMFPAPTDREMAGWVAQVRAGEESGWPTGAGGAGCVGCGCPHAAAVSKGADLLPRLA